jgi:hypothetical protein
MQDPVPDTVRGTLLGAHCVCATRLDGPNGVREPFVLRSHAESDIGVSLQVLWRPRQVVTLLCFTAPDRLAFGRGTVVRNLDTPPSGGCRTSVEIALEGSVDPRDVKGFHQLFVYGDHVAILQAWAQLYGLATESIG